MKKKVKAKKSSIKAKPVKKQRAKATPRIKKKAFDKKPAKRTSRRGSKKSPELEIKRTPRKKIVGKEIPVKKAETPEKKTIKEGSLEETTLPVLGNEERKAVKTAGNPVLPQEKVAWDKLPENIPSAIRFLVNAASRECQSAEGWPFPFAKFVSILPAEICGLGFAYLVMSLNHDLAEIADLSGITANKINEIVESTARNFDEKLSSYSPDMHRKIRALRGDPARVAEQLVSPNEITGVNRDFQLLLAQVLFRSLNPGV